MSRQASARPDLVTVGLFGLLALTFGSLSLLLPGWMLRTSLAVALVVALYGVVVLYRPDTVAGLLAPLPTWVAPVGAVVVAFFVLAPPSRAFAPVPVLLVVALVVVLLHAGFVVPVAYWRRTNEERTDRPDTSLPEITVVVPAYNEAGYIGRCVEALLDADYPVGKREVVVVDDGSTDGTYREAGQYRDDAVRVVRRENGGKHSALNYGLLFATGDVVVTVDADSVVEPDALRTLVGDLMADPDVGAVAGTVSVTNRSGLLTRLQAVEYVAGIHTYRRAFDAFGAVPVIPGCLGAFRRDLLDDIGAFDPDTLTEDFDATLQSLKADVAVRQSDARVRTEAPATWRDLYRQRLRWYRGNYRTLLKHRDVLVDADDGNLHRFVYPFHLVSSTLVPFAGAVVVGLVVAGVAAGRLAQVVTVFGAFVAIQSVIVALVVHWTDEDTRLLVVAPLLAIGYQQFVDLVKLKSLLDVVRSRDLAWTSPRRVRQRDASD